MLLLFNEAMLPLFNAPTQYSSSYIALKPSR